MTTQYKVGDVVDLLDGGNVVGKGTILHMGPNAILHNQPLPLGHFGMSINAVYKADVEIPYPPPHEDDIVTLGQAHNYIIAWPRFACAVCMFSHRLGTLGALGTLVYVGALEHMLSKCMRYHLGIDALAPKCIWVHLESVYALQMYPMRYHSAYGPYLWSVCAMVAHWVHLESINALQMHPNALECIWVHLESVYALQMYPMHYHSAYGPYLWSIFMVHMRYGSALGTFGEHRRKCTQMHWNERLCSPNVPNALP